MDMLRNSIFGQLARLITGGHLLPHRHDLDRFQKLYQELEDSNTRRERNEKVATDGESSLSSLEEAKTARDEYKLKRGDDGSILIGWYSEDDFENPQNWGSVKKYLVGLLICFTTFTFYMGASIYTPSIPYVMEEFDVGLTPASLGMAIYVLGYGLGPLLWSPLSEIPAIGRTATYVATFGVFVILLIPASLVENLAGFLVLRFLLGFFGSPCLATAGATFQDIFNPGNVIYIIGIWAAIGSCAPAFGPVLSAYSISVYGWRWSQWEILWLGGPTFLLLLFALPETSAATILLHRARRLRKLTGNDNLRSQSELDQAQMTVHEITFNALIKPWEINILDPAVLYTTFYTGLVYGIFYTYFEAFPMVYQDVYGFSNESLSLTYLSVAAAQLITPISYMAYFKYVVQRKIIKHGMGPLEDFLYVGLLASWLLPAGLFLFAFTGRESIHWVVSLVGAGLSISGIYVTTQCMFLYVPLCYPKYAASLLAANGLSRSLLAFAAILFAPPMFRSMGVEGGVSFLAALTVLCWGGLFVLYFFGAKLRARSKFAVS